ncbi:MAG: hypothetical protein R3F54_32665, partial [Alphaproteobacteria bacterium]
VLSPASSDYQRARSGQKVGPRHARFLPNAKSCAWLRSRYALLTAAARVDRLKTSAPKECRNTVPPKECWICSLGAIINKQYKVDLFKFIVSIFVVTLCVFDIIKFLSREAATSLHRQCGANIMDFSFLRDLDDFDSLILDPFEIVEIRTPEDLAETLGIDPADALARMREAGR